jgi:hypothetical protein
MTIRTIKQQGQLYGLDSATVVAKIDGAVVFNGTIDAVNQPIPALPSLGAIDGVDLFSWEEDVDYTGTRALEIYVTGATLILTDTLANYYTISQPWPDPTVPVPVVSSGETGFGWVYFVETDGVVVTDPLTNIAIDGNALLAPDRLDGLKGQWYWRVTSGSTLTATVNIKAGTPAT